MRTILKKKKLSLLTLIALLFILINTIIIFQVDKVDRTILISDPHITKKGTLKETIDAEGETEPSDIYMVFYEEPKGTLAEIMVEEGDEVSVGTPLLNYSNSNDNSVLTAELEEANGRLLAQKDKLNEDISVLQSEIEEYKRLQTEDDKEKQPDLDNTRIIEYEIKNIEYEIKMIDLQIEENQTQIAMLSKANEPIIIESQIDGVVVQKDEFSRTSDKPVLTIMNKSPLLIDALVGEDKIQRIKVDQEVLIKPKHLDSKMIKGKVIKISETPSKQDDKKDKSFYKISIEANTGDSSNEDTDSTLLIGSHVSAKITLKELNDVLILPKKTLAGNHVVLLDKGKLVKKKVKTGMMVNEEVVVTKGLKEKQRILPKGDSSVKGDTRYIKSVNFNYINKDAYKKFGMEESVWLLVRGMIQ